MKYLLTFLAIISTSFGGAFDNYCRIEQVDPTSTFTFYDWLPPLATGKDGLIVWDHTLNGGIGSTNSATFSSDFVLSGGVVSLVASPKRQETYSGTSAATTGAYTVTFATAYPVAPNIQANLTAPSDTQSLKVTSITTTGFTVVARNRTDALGLLPTYANASGLAIDVLITQK